jgi:hypothetical protein
MAIVLSPVEPLAPPQPPTPYPPPAPPVTLADVERALGARVGPFADLVVEQGLVPAQLQVAELRSSAELGGWENLYALRRGVYAPDANPNPPNGGDPVAGFDVRDRVRMVKTYLGDSGTLELDRDYLVNAVPGERLELHVLHPDWELRPAVLAGLERVFLFDRIGLVDNGNGTDPLDLTIAYPWLVDRSQVWGVEWIPPAAWQTSGLWGGRGQPVAGWDALQEGPNVVLDLPGSWPGAGNGTNGTGNGLVNLAVLVRRPGFSLVNGAEWVPGHVWADDDLLNVPLRYAAWAALVGAWEVARPRLVPMTQTGMWPTQQEAAAQLTRETNRWFRPDVRPPEDRLVGPWRLRMPSGSERPHWDPALRSRGRLVANG